MSLEIQVIALAHQENRFSDPQDRDLERRVTTFLSAQHRQGLRAVKPEAHRGVVTLRGQVGSFYEKQLSTQLTRRVAGVVGLVDKLIVRENRPDRQEHRPDRRQIVRFAPVISVGQPLVEPVTS